jgi:fucose permease
MAIALLILIYIAFISLGLPDGLLGAAWPSMYQAMAVPVSFAGYVTMIIAGGTIISSLSSDRLSQKVSTQWILVISVALTALAIFGFSFSSEYWQLCLWAIPYGLGAGAVDSSLNNYVSLHYKSRQMSWLHSCWGVGATLGPYIISLTLGHSLGWEWGYRIVGFIQAALVVILLSSARLWRINDNISHDSTEEIKREHLGFFKTWGLKGTAFVFLAFYAYCSLESTAGLWAASYFVLNRGASEERAASWASLYYFGIGIGRFLMGFIANRLGDRKMVRLGLIILAVGLIVILLPWGEYTPLIGLLIIGLGCAPVYPSLIHETPTNFGKEHSQEVIGIQMATAYVGSTFMPPLFGLLIPLIGIVYYPYYLGFFFLVLILMSELLNHATKEKWVSENKKSPAEPTSISGR